MRAIGLAVGLFYGPAGGALSCCASCFNRDDDSLAGWGHDLRADAVMRAVILLGGNLILGLLALWALR